MASWYWVSVFSITMFGHQSLFFAGPIQPSGDWWMSVQSIHFRALAVRRASSSR